MGTIIENNKIPQPIREPVKPNPYGTNSNKPSKPVGAPEIFTPTPQQAIMMQKKIVKKVSLEEARKRLKDMRTDWQNNAIKDKVSVLLLGIYSSGKTSFLRTCPAPVLIDSHDPRTKVLDDLIDSGRVILRPFWNENYKDPTEYKRWEESWNMDISEGVLDHVGTYSLDSITGLIQNLGNYIAMQAGRSKKAGAIQAGKLFESDYPALYATIEDIVKRTSTMNCHFISTAHLVPHKEEIGDESRMIYEIDTFKKLKSRIPRNYTEKWCIERIPGALGVVTNLIVQPRYLYHAGTQIGKNGIFSPIEEPNFKKLLKKAGYPYEDKYVLNN